MMATATQTALSTYEILEPILLLLDMKDIYRQQRVSSAWQAVITRSQALQKKMFRLAIGPALTPRLEDGRSHYTVPQMIELNPAVMTYSKRLSLVDSAAHVLAGEYHAPYFTFRTYERTSGMTVRVTTRQNLSPPDRRERRIRKSQRPMQDFWRAMLLTQPPVKAMTLWHNDIFIDEENLHLFGPSNIFIDEEYMRLLGPHSRFERRFVPWMTLYNPAGLTLGDVYDCVFAWHDVEIYNVIDLRLRWTDHTPTK